MYYKIENTECEVYQKLHDMRTAEIKMKQENEAAIEEKTGSAFDSFLGHHGQSGFSRVSTYDGFKFLNSENIDLKAWKISEKHPEVHVPNRRTKAGKEMYKFLSNGLQKSWFQTPLDILGLEIYGRFHLPFVEIVGEVIILFLDNNLHPKDPNVIEITRTEWEKLRTGK
ncbi:hypothetical protein Oweho_3229 [Owenweeksia hongkongensis DSM 17368]|uniref:Uncharacterized protein n=1 Tax=Owenweeksia hongkongensis (strain DSM 17368 / CIP 108786 / JCM 12287 / NRRL B-23963 / UST20020801) TaxID=926562 RepID=G8R3U3_OWEHD|nr:hypothetical protein [Owenweeksia hongkongensis]AEV34180.1 hypothetical protein Oweho_3229 [Owenweeksia hongkongensis DSM 17368]